MSKICKVENCTTNALAKGYCPKHYMRFARPLKPCSVEGCDNPIAGRRLCKQHYYQASKTNFAGFDVLNPNDSFDEKYTVNQTTGCWNWVGAISGDGYGSLSDGTRMAKAHRFSYGRFVGKIPEGLVICHKCDNTLCVNPDHLFVGTMKDNMEDMVIKRRSNKLFGENHNQAKLTDAEVVEIRSCLKRGVKGVDLARQFNVTPQMVSLIKSGKFWKHLL